MVTAAAVKLGGNIEQLKWSPDDWRQIYILNSSIVVKYMARTLPIVNVYINIHVVSFNDNCMNVLKMHCSLQTNSQYYLCVPL